ncbi:MAG: transglutaminase-like cysteine peptidase [Hyphomicrobiales bacterium]
MLKWGASAFAVALMVAASGGQAAESRLFAMLFSPAKPSSFAKVYGQALPPVGFVDFCTRHASDCRPLGGTNFQLQMTDERWELMNQVNSFVNGNIKPATDQEIYHKPEYWEYPQKAGDCEDYVLLKKRYLEGLGFPAEALLITVVLDESGEGHAVLMVKTDRGDLVLDNRRDNILLWSDTRYDYLKRQSQDDPQIWVALTNKNRPSQMTAGGN